MFFIIEMTNLEEILLKKACESNFSTKNQTIIILVELLKCKSTSNKRERGQN
jgi:hypothetical protein